MPNYFDNYTMAPGSINGFQPNYDQMQYYQNEQNLMDQAARQNLEKEQYVAQLQQNSGIVQQPLKAGGFHFTVKDEPQQSVPNMTLQNPDTALVVQGIQPLSTKKHTSRKKKPETVSGDIVRADDSDVSVEDNKTIQTYQYTSQLLGETLEQVDMVTSEIKEEMDTIRLSRTMKGKYTYLANLADNLATLLNTKANVIKEINNTITKSNELDYRREKDKRDAASNQAGDDKYIMDMYNAFLKAAGPQQISQYAPTSMQNAMPGADIVRADTPDYYKANNGKPIDQGYLNYLSNLTPEQNTMFYENYPNVKTVVVYDADTGNKFFQVMNIATGQVVPNVTTLDNRFLEDTTIDLKNKIAKNNNLRETYPVVIINDNIAKEY